MKKLFTLLALTISFSLNAQNTNYGTNTLASGSLTGTNNSAFGYESSYQIHSGYDNTSVGFRSLYSLTSGYRNTAIGYESMYANNNLFNVAVGFQTMRNNTGSANTAIGYQSQFTSSSGEHNVSMGHNSMYGNTGNRNVGIGNTSLWQVTGSDNTMVGHESGHGITSGSYNVGVGRNVLRDVSTGSYNIVMGYDADVSTGAASNQIVIGYNATGQANNSVTLGNSNVTAVYMGEDSGATVYAGGLNIGGAGVTTTAAELNILDGVTASATELNLIDGVTSTTAELNILDGVTATAAELNLLDGVTSLMTSSGNTTLDILSETGTDAWGNSLNSLYIGNNPSSTTDDAFQNIAVGKTALKSITTGDQNTVVGWESGKVLTLSLIHI